MFKFVDNKSLYAFNLIIVIDKVNNLVIKFKAHSLMNIG